MRSLVTAEFIEVDPPCLQIPCTHIPGWHHLVLTETIYNEDGMPNNGEKAYPPLHHQRGSIKLQSQDLARHKGFTQNNINVVHVCFIF
jgi:hypothetical protein